MKGYETKKLVLYVLFSKISGLLRHLRLEFFVHFKEF